MPFAWIYSSNKTPLFNISVLIYQTESINATCTLNYLVKTYIDYICQLLVWGIEQKSSISYLTRFNFFDVLLH